MSILGALPSFYGKDYQIRIIDRTSGWPESIPTQRITSKAVTEILVNNWFLRFRVSAVITTDQGRQFRSDLFKPSPIFWAHSTSILHVTIPS